MRKLLSALALLLWSLPAANADDLRLGELLADPASDWNGAGEVHSRDDEWIEIINLSASAIDLTGVRLASADSVWRYEYSGMLQPGNVAVAYGSDSYAWEQKLGFPAYGLRLANGGGTIGLWRLSEVDSVLIDEVTYLDDDAEDDRSTGRSPDNPDEWLLYDGLNPYGGDAPPIATGCPPTPGHPNGCTSPVPESTWGMIKAIFLDGSVN